MFDCPPPNEFSNVRTDFHVVPYPVEHYVPDGVQSAELAHEKDKEAKSDRVRKVPSDAQHDQEAKRNAHETACQLPKAVWQ